MRVGLRSMKQVYKMHPVQGFQTIASHYGGTIVLARFASGQTVVRQLHIVVQVWAYHKP